MNYSVILMFTILTIHIVTAEEDLLGTYLNAIKANSPDIHASLKKSETERVLAKTGNPLPGPEFTYGYSPGNRSEIGTKQTIGAYQSFHFPSVYSNKSALSQKMAQSSNAFHEKNVTDLLVSAARNYMQLIHLNKSVNEMKTWVQEAEKALDLTEKKVDAGDANLLDLQKARMEVVKFKNEYLRKTAARQAMLSVISASNGGATPPLPDTLYPLFSLPSADSLSSLLPEISPELRLVKTQQETAEKNISFQKSLNLPLFTVGYEEETILDNTYRGVLAGVTIPLWQNANTVKHAKLQLQTYQQEYAAMLQNQEALVRAKAIELSAALINLNQTRQALETTRNIAALRKSLESGNISILDYFRERQYWIEANDNFLLEEGAYFTDAVEIMKYFW